MNKWEEAKKLMKCFPGSFINSSGEFIAHRISNSYFNLDICKTELEVKCRMLEWLSRGACKTTPFRLKSNNEEFHRYMRECINTYLGTEFTHEDMELIYEQLGNCLNRPITLEFIKSGYNLEVLRRSE